MAKDIPVCPTIMTYSWLKDPRLSKDILWWVENIFKEYMRNCVIFCYIPNFAGVTSKRMDAEKALWHLVGTGKFIIADRIVDYLLNLETTL